MAHLHSIYDSDKHFVIDAISKTIKNVSSKITLVQYDHNSERFTFELPRYIEGHDMSICNRVEVHYTNIDSVAKMQNDGVYEVDDLQISPDDEDIVICSWLISQEATMLAGSLQFLLRFSCLGDDGVIEYAWNTLPHTGITVAKGIYNSHIVAEQYTDTLKAWENRLEVLENSVGSNGISPIVSVSNIFGGHRVTITDAEDTETFDVMDGIDGGASHWDDLEGKPFGEVIPVYSYEKTNLVYDGTGVILDGCVLETNREYDVTMGDVTTHSIYNSQGIMMLGKDAGGNVRRITTTENGILFTHVDENRPTSIKIVTPETTITTIDEKYLPESVKGGGLSETEVINLIAQQLGVIENGTY